MANGELRKGGLIGTGIGAILGGIALVVVCVASAPVSVPAGFAIVLGTAAVGALAGASTGK